jgi:hypothetical protein
MVPLFCDFCRLLWFQLLWIVFNKQLVPNALVQERISSYYLFLEPYEEILHQLSNNLYYLLSRVLLRTICFNISNNEEIKKESHENESDFIFYPLFVCVVTIWLFIFFVYNGIEDQTYNF